MKVTAVSVTAVSVPWNPKLMLLSIILKSQSLECLLSLGVDYQLSIVLTNERHVLACEPDTVVS